MIKKPLLVLGLITSNLLVLNWPSYQTDFFLHIFFPHSKWAIKIRSKTNMEQAAPNWSVPRSYFSACNSTSPKFLPAMSHVSDHSVIITSKFRPLMPSQVMSRTLPFDLQVQCRSSGHLSPDPCCFNLPLSCTPEIMK